MFDELPTRHAGIPTKEDPRTCKDCDNLSAGHTCLAAKRGELDGAPTSYAPALTVPRYCLVYRPRYGSYERRTGVELWPEIAAVAELELPGEVENRAIALVTSFLGEGPRLAKDIIAAGRVNGLNSRAIQRATVWLRVVKTREKFRGGWSWQMPTNSE